MNSIVQHTHLHIYQSKTQKTTSLSRILTAKRVDAAVIVTSIAGLFSAFVFLITMS